MGLNEGKPFTHIFDPKGYGGYPPNYKKYFNELVSMGYIEENTNKPTETSLLLLQAYKELKRVFRGEEVKEWLFIDEGVEKLSLSLLKGLKGHRVRDDIYAQILIKARESASKYSMTNITNYVSLEKCLEILRNVGLIDLERGKWKTTEQGLEYVKRYLYFILFAMGGKEEDKWEILD